MTISKKIYGDPKKRFLSNDWMTPIEYTQNLDVDFDLDPCVSLNQRDFHAKKGYTIKDDGLKKDWKGRVWLNPPYSREIGLWMKKIMEHGNGIALIPARTDTRWFQDYVFQPASAILFLKGRIKFIGSKHYAKNPCSFPCVLASYDNFIDGYINQEALKEAQFSHDLFKGYYVRNI